MNVKPIKIKHSAAAIVLDQDEYLMVVEKKTNSRAFPDVPQGQAVVFVNFAGGKLEGKTIEETLAEEISQEAGAELQQVGNHLCRITKIDMLTNEKIIKDFYDCTIDTSIPLKEPNDPDGDALKTIRLNREEMLIAGHNHVDKAIGRVMQDVGSGIVGCEYVWIVDGTPKTEPAYINQL